MSESAAWERVGPAFDAFFSAITAMPAERLLDACGVGPGRRFLDAGAGGGAVAALAASRDADVVAVDAAGSLVELLRRRGIPAVQADVARLPFEEASFDAAAGNFLLLHLESPEAALAELVRVLRPGARLALSVWGPPERSRLLGLPFEAAERAGAAVDRGLFRFSDPDALGGALEGAGLDEVRVETLAWEHELASAAELWDALAERTTRVSALLSSASPELRARIRREFDALASAHGRDGRLALPLEALVGSGRRSVVAP